MADTDVTQPVAEIPATTPEPAPGVIKTDLAEKPASREPSFAWMERMVEKADVPAQDASTATPTEAAAVEEPAPVETPTDTPPPGDFDDIIEHLRKKGLNNSQEVRAHAEATQRQAQEQQELQTASSKLWAEKYQAKVDAGELSYEDAADRWRLEMKAFQSEMTAQRYERMMAEATEKREVEEILADPKMASFKETGDEGLDLARVYSELAQVPLRDSAAYFNKLLTAAEERGAAREKGKQNAALEKLKTNNAAVVPVMGGGAAPAGQSAPGGDWMQRKVERAEAGLN